MDATRGSLSSATNRTEPEEHMPSMIVTNQHNTKVGKHHVAVIGQRETWTITAPGNTVTGLTLRFNPPDAAVGNYEPTDAQTTVTAVIPLPAAATFYWTRTGAVTVTLTARIGPRTVSHIIEAQLLSPNVLEFTGTTNETTIKRTVPPGRIADAKDEEIAMLRYGTDSVPGIRFDVKISMPTKLLCAGRVSMLQTLIVNRKKTCITGQVEHAQSREYVLNQQLSYGLTHNATERATLATPAGQYVFTTEDSPSTTLGTSGKNRAYSRVDVDEHYRMYLMYRPANGIWVAVGLVSWRWQACAFYDDANVTWKIQPAGSGNEQRIIAQSALFGRLPQWKANVGDKDLLEKDH